VVLSTSAANYGDNPVLPKVETMCPEPMTPYSITKLDGEFYSKMYQDQYNVPTASLRYFNVFGPRQNPESAYAAAVPIFINKALQNQPITIYGDGLQTRDFIYVKDVVKANILAFKSNGKNQAQFDSERAKVVSILENEKYQQLMKVGSGKDGASISYVGDDDHIEEFVLFANKKETGFAVIRVLGKDMNPTNIMTMLQVLQKANIDLEQLKPLQQLIK